MLHRVYLRKIQLKYWITVNSWKFAMVCPIPKRFCIRVIVSLPVISKMDFFFLSYFGLHCTLFCNGIILYFGLVKMWNLTPCYFWFVSSGNLFQTGALLSEEIVLSAMALYSVFFTTLLLVYGHHRARKVLVRCCFLGFDLHFVPERVLKVMRRENLKIWWHT